MSCKGNRETAKPQHRRRPHRLSPSLRRLKKRTHLPWPLRSRNLRRNQRHQSRVKRPRRLYPRSLLLRPSIPKRLCVSVKPFERKWMNYLPNPLPKWRSPCLQPRWPRLPRRVSRLQSRPGRPQPVRCGLLQHLHSKSLRRPRRLPRRALLLQQQPSLSQPVRCALPRHRNLRNRPQGPPRLQARLHRPMIWYKRSAPPRPRPR